MIEAGTIQDGSGVIRLVIGACRKTGALMVRGNPQSALYKAALLLLDSPLPEIVRQDNRVLRRFVSPQDPAFLGLMLGRLQGVSSGVFGCADSSLEIAVSKLAQLAGLDKPHDVPQDGEVGANGQPF